MMNLQTSGNLTILTKVQTLLQQAGYAEWMRKQETYTEF